VLQGFIKKYVQCYSCGNPETVVKVKKENISLKCKACGAISEVDARLKLNTFIIKNPPENKLSKAEKKVKKAEAERMAGLTEEAAEGMMKVKKDKDKSKKSSSKKKKDGEGDGSLEPAGSAENGEGDDEEEDEEEEVVWQTDTSEAAMKARAAEQLSAATAALVTQGNVEAEREAARRREEKRLAQEAEDRRRAEEAEEAERLAKEAAKKLVVEEPADWEALAAELASLMQQGAAPEKVQMAMAAATLCGGAAGRLRALYGAILGGASPGDKLDILVNAHTRYLAPHSRDASGQLFQLVALEHLLAAQLPARAREVPAVLKTLYDEDLVDEKIFVAWFNKSTAAGALGVGAEEAAAVRAAAKRFVDWLEEAEEDSDEDDSDEE
jgi:translation initiation factor 5